MVLQRGQRYQLKDSSKNTGQRGTYVRKERFQDGTEWETFYDFLGGVNLSSSGGVVNMGGVPLRIRIPADSIEGIDGENILFREGLVVKLVQDYSGTRTSLVESWLKEVKELTHQTEIA